MFTIRSQRAISFTKLRTQKFLRGYKRKWENKGDVTQISSWLWNHHRLISSGLLTEKTFLILSWCFAARPMAWRENYFLECVYYTISYHMYCPRGYLVSKCSSSIINGRELVCKRVERLILDSHLLSEYINLRYRICKCFQSPSQRTTTVVLLAGNIFRDRPGLRMTVFEGHASDHWQSGIACWFYSGCGCKLESGICEEVEVKLTVFVIIPIA